MRLHLGVLGGNDVLKKFLGPRQRMLAELYWFGLVRLSVRVHSNSVIFNGISSKFHIWIASINLSFKFEYGFCPTSDNKDGGQNGHHLSISAVVVTLTQSFLIRFLPNFIYELLLSTFHSSLNMGFIRHSNFVILYGISFKFHL